MQRDTASAGAAPAALERDTRARQSLNDCLRKNNFKEVKPGTKDRDSLTFVYHFVANLLQLFTVDYLEAHTFLGQLRTTQMMFLS